MLRYPQPHLGPDRLRDWRLHNTTGMLSSQWQIQDTTIFAERYRTLLGQTELPGSLRPGSVPKIVVPWHFRDKSPRKTRKAHTLRSVCSYYTAQFSPWCLRFGSPGKCVFWQTMVNDQRPKLMVQMHGIDIDGLVDTRADVNILAQKSCKKQATLAFNLWLPASERTSCLICQQGILAPGCLAGPCVPLF